MPKPRRTTGPERTTAMRKNSRNLGQNQPFQGGLALNQGVSPKQPGTGAGQRPIQNPGGCPAGQQPVRDPRTGGMTCKPAQTIPGQARPVGGAGVPTGNRPLPNKEGY